MFENRISNTKLTGSLADCMFRRINGCEYEGDSSFLATVRVLLMGRIPDGNEVNIQNDNIVMTEKTSEWLSARVANHQEPNTIYVIGLPYDVTSCEEQTEIAKFDAITFPENFHEFTDVREFFASKMFCRTAVCEESKTTIIMIVNMNLKRYHLIQCIIPKLLPWYFDRGRVSANEKALLRSMREIRPAEYERLLNVLCDTEEFRQRHTVAAMASWKRRGLERQKQEVERSINNFNSRIESLNMDILTNIRHLNNENMKLNGILAALNGDIDTSDELTQFISRSKNVKMVVDNSDGLSFVIRGYLDIFDSESYRTLARNVNSWYWQSYRATGVFSSREARKKIADAIFGPNPTFKLKTCGAFRIDPRTNEVSARSHYEYGADYLDCYPNPHLDYNSCLGNHRAPINRALGRGDLVGAISQCISSVHSVNVTESASFRHVFEDIFSNTHSILEDMNGQAYTVQQAYEYLVQQERAAQQNNQGE